MMIGCVLKNWLGDVMFATPSIRALRRCYPSAKIVCFVPQRCRDILQHHPCVDQIIVFDERSEQKSLMQKIKFISAVKALKLDRIYLFHRSLTKAVVFSIASVHHRVGFDTNARRWFLTEPIREPQERMHSVNYHLELLKRSGIPVQEDAVYDFHFDRQNLDRAKWLIEKLGLGSNRFVAIHPGANWDPKRWPAEHFGMLAQKIVEKWNAAVIITGSDHDRALAEKIQTIGAHRLIRSVAGETNLHELGALFSLSSLMISSDSGPLHIAGGVGTNVVGIFGPTDPVLTGPRGRGKNIVIHYVPEGVQVPWYGAELPHGGWMEHISTDEVISTIEKESLL